MHIILLLVRLRKVVVFSLLILRPVAKTKSGRSVAAREC